MTLRPFRRTTRLHKTLSSDNMFFQHSGAVSAFGRRPRSPDPPPQTLQAKRRSMGGAEEAIAGIANESSAQVRMFNSTNASSNKPTLVVTYKPDYYGGAYAYADGVFSNANCLGYALRLNQSLKPGTCSYLQSLSGHTAISYYNACIEPLIESLGKSSNIISRTEAISSNEYRVAMRLTEDDKNIGGVPLPADYHFWVENKNEGWKGLWSHKSGTSACAQITTTDNPSDNVDEWCRHHDQWTNTYYYYDSPTIYFTVTR